MSRITAYYGTIVHSLAASQPFVVEPNTLLVIEDSKISISQAAKDEDDAKKILKEAGLEGKVDLRTLHEDEFLMPGFVDTHIHAPQYVTVGVGYQLQLLDWLNTYTFPAETKFSDAVFAEQVYERVVKRTLRNGTTTASYFATIHLEASIILANQMDKYRQRGFVGKVCMDESFSPTKYLEKTDDSIASTRQFIETLKKRFGSKGLIEPCVTPRFALSCSKRLMSELGAMAKEYDVPIQTHMSENLGEIEFIKSQNADINEYVQVYERAGLLSQRTILAHCVYSNDVELGIVKRTGCGIAHCPNSNTTIRSGVMDSKMVLEKGVKLGLGTDVSGGYSSSILDNLRKSVEMSKLLSIFNKKDSQAKDGDGFIDHRTAFYLATLGGAEVMGLEKKIGNFKVGKEFDALLVKGSVAGGPYDTFGSVSVEEMVQKFLYCGDDRNIREVYVAGQRVNV